MTYENLTVDNVMSTALITAMPDETVDAADFDMRLASIRHIPIVDGRNHLVGVVSDRDILRAFSKLGRSSVTMKDVMTINVRTIRADALAHEAVSILVDHKIGCLPVEGDEGQLVGVITETDFLHIARDMLLERCGADEEDEQ